MAVELTATDYSGIGTGASATYATGIYANAASQMKVYVDDVLKTLGDDYSLNGIGSAGGVDVVGVFALGAKVYVERVTPITQLVDTQNNETILEDVLDGQFDKLTLIAQELSGKAGRAVLGPKGAPGLSLDIDGLLDGDLIEYRQNALRRVGRESFAGKYYAGDATGRLTPSAGTGSDSALRADLASPAAGLALVRYTPAQAAPFIQTRSALERLRDEGSTAKDTGATGDGLADDTEALQEIFDYFGARGGSWRFPAGAYKTTGPIAIPMSTRGQVITGTGMRGVYPGAFNVAAASDLSVIIPAHSGRQAITFKGQTGDSTVIFRDLAIAALPTGSKPVAAFGWDTTDLQFLRNFQFLGCSITDFTSAFDVYQTSGAMRQVGLFKAMFCNIHRNLWIARCLDGTQFNGFEFSYNEAGQNGFLVGQGGLDIAAHNANIVGNCLEGMRDPIKIAGAFRGVDIRGNYFETNVGKALIQLEGVRGPWNVSANTVLDVGYGGLDHQLLLQNCGPGNSDMPYRPSIVHKMRPQVIGADAATGDNTNNPDIGTANEGYVRVDSFEHGTYAREPEYLTVAKQRVTIAQRDVSPANGQAMPVEEYTSTGTGLVSFSHTLAGSAGNWVVVTIPVKYDPAVGLANIVPYISLAVNGAAGNGGRDYQVSQLGAWWRGGEWIMLTFAIKLTGAMTSLATGFYPFGVSPASGLKVRYLRPIVYTCQTPDQILPWFDQFLSQSAPSSPAAGDWQQGDWIYHSAPAAGGQTRFVCTTAGAPGAWVFG